MKFVIKEFIQQKYIKLFIIAITVIGHMTTKPPKQKLSHPWKSRPFQVKTAIEQAAVRKELKKRGIK